MLRAPFLHSALICGLLASGSTARADEPAPVPSVAAGDFDALVKKGDQARIAGKWSPALEAYAAALEIRDDSLVAGRLGLVLLEFREYDAAAGKLFVAIEKGAGINDTERTRFFQAYLVAKKQTCRLDITISQTGAKFEVDGEPWLDDRREFWTFVKPGKHKLRVKLEGFAEQTMEIDAPKGGQMNLAFSLVPVKPPEKPEKEADAQPQPSKSETLPSDDKRASVVVEDKPPPPTNVTSTNGSFVMGGGLGLVLGTTPTPAIGPNIFGAWRSRSWWEVGVDARVAWTFVKDERFPTTQFVTWSAMVAPCGRLRDRWFGCAIVGLDGMTGGSQLKRAVLPVFGLRVGREFVLREPFRLQIFGDLAAHASAFEFVADAATWRGSFLTGSIGARVIYKF